MFRLHDFHSGYPGTCPNPHPGQHRLLRLASRARRDAESIKEEDLARLRVRLQTLALCALGTLDVAFSVHKPVLSEISRALVLCREAQELLDEALDGEMLSPEFFVELNTDWERLARLLEKLAFVGSEDG